jgi:selenoprotein W-related protein
MTDKLFGEFGSQIVNLTLIPSSGGVFEIMVDGQLIFSKKELKRHAVWEEVRDAVQALSAA